MRNLPVIQIIIPPPSGVKKKETNGRKSRMKKKKKEATPTPQSRQSKKKKNQTFLIQTIKALPIVYATHAATNISSITFPVIPAEENILQNVTERQHAHELSVRLDHHEPVNSRPPYRVEYRVEAVVERARVHAREVLWGESMLADAGGI